MRGRSGVVVEEELSARTAAAAPEMDVGVRVRGTGAASRVVERRAVWRR